MVGVVYFNSRPGSILMEDRRAVQLNSDFISLTDEQLVLLVTAGQDLAYAELMQRYQDKLHRYILRISGFSKEEAEDVLQEVFLSAYRNLNDFDTELKFSSWIYRIAHNRTISQYRKLKARPQTVTYEGDDELLNYFASDEDIFRELNQKHDALEVRKILNELDEKYREVLTLKFLEDKDYREISDILEKPMGTVATLINRAKAQFREKLKVKDV